MDTLGDWIANLVQIFYCINLDQCLYNYYYAALLIKQTVIVDLFVHSIVDLLLSLSGGGGGGGGGGSSERRGSPWLQPCLTSSCSRYCKHCPMD